jgi:hypothetical protein
MGREEGEREREREREREGEKANKIISCAKNACS